MKASDTCARTAIAALLEGDSPGVEAALTDCGQQLAAEYGRPLPSYQPLLRVIANIQFEDLPRLTMRYVGGTLVDPVTVTDDDRIMQDLIAEQYAAGVLYYTATEEAQQWDAWWTALVLLLDGDRAEALSHVVRMFLAYEAADQASYNYDGGISVTLDCPDDDLLAELDEAAS